MKLTRRGLLAALPLAAQAPAPPVERLSRDQDLEAARTAIKTNLSTIAKVEVKIGVEPSFVFRPLP